MANERIEIDIVLNDGSVAKAFAQIPKAAQDASKKASGALGSIEGDFKKLGSGLSTIRASFVGLGAALGAGLAIQKVSNFIGDAVREAVAGEEAINNLANALRSAGDLSQANVDKFKAFANETQRTTKFADDQVLSLSALARNYAKSSDQAIELTKAAIQLSAATGIDATSAIDQLGGTLNGVSGRIGKLIPGFKGLSEEALKSGAAIDLVNQRFGGSAESQVNTYAGSIAQLKNEFSDFLEGIGNLIIRSPALTAVFTEVGNIFREFSQSVSNLTANNQDVLGPIIAQAIKFGLTFNDFVIRPFEILGNAVAVSFNIIKLQFNFAIAAIGKIGGAIGAVLKPLSNITGVGGGIADTLLTFEQSSGSQFINQIGKTFDAAANVGSQTFADGIESNLSRIGEAVAKASTTLLPEVKNIGKNVGKGFGEGISNGIKEDAKLEELRTSVLNDFSLLENEVNSLNLDGLKQQFAELPGLLAILNADSAGQLNALKVNFDNFKNNGVKTAQEFNAQFQSIGTSIRTGLVNAVSSGMVSIGEALAAGENPLKNFAGAFLSVIADLAQQVGTTLIGLGLGLQSLTAAFSNPITGGPALVAAGAAILVVAGILKGLAKKSGSKGSAPGSSLTAPGTPATPISGASDSVGDKRSAVNLTVQGNVYDPQGTGLAIADLLKSAGFDGAVVV